MRLRRKLAWISVLYFAEGFPFGIAYDVWPVYFRVHGVSLADIGLMALLFLPYTLKPAWAPLVDRMGSRQVWVVAAEVALAAATVILLALDPSQTAASLWVILLAFTLLSATQDIAIDAFAVDVSTPTHSGAINGVRVSAWRVAMVAAGGLFLVLADFAGWTVTWLAVAVLFLVLAAAVFASPRVPRERPERSSAPRPELRRWRAGSVGLAAVAALAAWSQGWSGGWLTLAVIAAALAVGSFLDPALVRWAVRKEMAVVVAFTLLYKVGDSTLGRMVKPFWVDKGLSPTEIGLISVTLGTALTIAGALLGGWFTTRRGIFQGLLWCGLIQLGSNFGYVSVAALELPRWSIYIASVVESFSQGLGTAAFLAFLTNLCDRRHGATQFALLSAVFALSRDVAGAFSGFGVEAWGYAIYFTFTALLALPALLMLPWVKPRIRTEGGEPPSLPEMVGGEA